MPNEKVASRSEEGFTLVELLLAILIIGIAVSAMVAALGSMAQASSNHRSWAVLESTTHNYAEAIQSKAALVVPLSAVVYAPGTHGLPPCPNTGTINDTLQAASPYTVSSFGSVTPFYAVVDQETLSVTGGSGQTLNVTRCNTGTIATGHSATTATITQLLVCPGTSSSSSDSDGSHNIGYLNPDGYIPPAAEQGTPAATAQIQAPPPPAPSRPAISYWDPTDSQFDFSQSQCWSHFTAVCFDPAAPNHLYDLRPECDLGLTQVTLFVDVGKNSGYPENSSYAYTIVRRASN
jgi:prepilin-type N-terminal cleavage/methylation domain-containing protein